MTQHIPGPPAWALRQEGPIQNVPALKDQDAAETTDNGDHLACAACRTPITRKRYRIARAGQHTHVFFNPHGLIFEIGCFSSAGGCCQTGEPSSEFTWFPGYAWQITLCTACGLHLGWRFNSPDGDGFYGFILGCLLEQPL